MIDPGYWVLAPVATPIMQGSLIAAGRTMMAAIFRRAVGLIV
jgi:hypothetical protein